MPTRNVSMSRFWPRRSVQCPESLRQPIMSLFKPNQRIASSAIVAELWQTPDKDFLCKPRKQRPRFILRKIRSMSSFREIQAPLYQVPGFFLSCSADASAEGRSKDKAATRSSGSDTNNAPSRSIRLDPAHSGDLANPGTAKTVFP